MLKNEALQILALIYRTRWPHRLALMVSGYDKSPEPFIFGWLIAIAFIAMVGWVMWQFA